MAVGTSEGNTAQRRTKNRKKKTVGPGGEESVALDAVLCLTKYMPHAVKNKATASFLVEGAFH